MFVLNKLLPEMKNVDAIPMNAPRPNVNAIPSLSLILFWFSGSKDIAAIPEHPIS